MATAVIRGLFTDFSQHVKCQLLPFTCDFSSSRHAHEGARGTRGPQGGHPAPAQDLHQVHAPGFPAGGWLRRQRRAFETMRELRACDAAAGSTALLSVGMIGRPYSPSKTPSRVSRYIPDVTCDDDAGLSLCMCRSSTSKMQRCKVDLCLDISETNYSLEDGWEPRAIQFFFVIAALPLSGPTDGTAETTLSEPHPPLRAGSWRRARSGCSGARWARPPLTHQTA